MHISWAATVCGVTIVGSTTGFFHTLFTSGNASNGLGNSFGFFVYDAPDLLPINAIEQPLPRPANSPRTRARPWGAARIGDTSPSKLRAPKISKTTPCKVAGAGMDAPKAS
jgi:hypothetical protein